MAETVNRLSAPGDDCKTAPVTATTIPTTNRTAMGAGLPQREEEKQMLQVHDNKSQSATKYVKMGQGNTTGAGSDQEETPTLRLRLNEIENRLQTVATVGGGNTTTREGQRSRSKSPSRKPRQAVTSPRRIQAKSVGAGLLSPPERDLDLNSDLNMDNFVRTMCEKPHRSLLHRLTFDEWLITKDKQDAQRRRLDRRELNRQTHMQQLRQELSDKCYADWLRSKRQRGNGNMSSQQQQQQHHRGNKVLPTLLVESERNRAEETKKSVQQWERRKILELQRRREQQMREQEERQVRDQLRQHLSQLAWHRWLDQQEQHEQQKQQQQQKQQRQQQQQQQEQLQQQQQRQQQQKRRGGKLQHQRQLDSLYLHVPLSAAQRSLRQRLDSMDGLHLLRRRH